VVTRDPPKTASYHGDQVLFLAFLIGHNLCFLFNLRVQFYSQIKLVIIVVLYILTFTVWDRRWGDSFSNVKENCCSIGTLVASVLLIITL
jgi:hypothetical protein